MKITYSIILTDGTKITRTAKIPSANWFYTYIENWIELSQKEDSNPAVDYEIESVN